MCMYVILDQLWQYTAPPMALLLFLYNLHNLQFLQGFHIKTDVRSLFKST